MPDCHPHQEHKRCDDPGIFRAERQRVMVREHQEDDGQGQIVVVGRAQLGDFSILRIRLSPCLQIRHHDALVRHDDEEDVGRHDGGRKRAEVKKSSAAGKDLIVPPAHRDKHREKQQHQNGRLLAQRGFAKKIID